MSDFMNSDTKFLGSISRSNRTHWMNWSVLQETTFDRSSTFYQHTDYLTTTWNMATQKSCNANGPLERVDGLINGFLCSGTQNQKYSQISLFDIPLRLLGGSAWQHPVINKLADVYFHDYSLANLMIFVSYMSHPTLCHRSKHTHLIDE